MHLFVEWLCIIERFSGILTALFTLALAAFTLALVIVARKQLGGFTRQVRADFLYRISRDLDYWLAVHKEARKWIFDDLDKEKLGRARFNEWEFDDFLGFFETIWSFDKKGLIDKEIVYDLFSDYLIWVYEANDYEIEKMIKEMREEEHGKDFYEGVMKLYEEMKELEEKKYNFKNIKK